MHGRVRHIHVATDQRAPPTAVDTVEAVAEAGIRGDRYFDAAGTFADREGSDLTLIAVEALETVEREYGIALEPGVHRRNVTTEGVSLAPLVGERFRVGEAVCLGTERCTPCAYLEAHLEQRGVREALVGRGGLRCRILEGGSISVGDLVEASVTRTEE